MKRIVTIQDISCFGKCSITVALPIISAMGVETAIIPTAVLSTHTMFNNFTCKDLEDQIMPVTEHWKEQNFKFDGIYTGYLASAEQIETVMTAIDKIKSDDTYIVVDPAMADNGSLYPAFNNDFPKAMAKLCGVADIILPNITEACFLTGTEYKEEYDESYIEELIKKLTLLNSKKIVLKGVTLNGKFGVLCYDCLTGEHSFYAHERIPVSYHGTGDVFASTFVGSIMRGKTIEESVKIASDFTVESIKITYDRVGKNNYSVDFETAMPYLIDRINK